MVHDDVIKWQHFPRYWLFVRGIHRFPVNSPPKGQWHWALMFSLICARINGWANNGEAGDLKRYRALHDVILMSYSCYKIIAGSVDICCTKLIEHHRTKTNWNQRVVVMPIFSTLAAPGIVVMTAFGEMATNLAVWQFSGYNNLRAKVRFAFLLAHAQYCW